MKKSQSVRDPRPATLVVPERLARHVRTALTRRSKVVYCCQLMSPAHGLCCLCRQVKSLVQRSGAPRLLKPVIAVMFPFGVGKDRQTPYTMGPSKYARKLETWRSCSMAYCCACCARTHLDHRVDNKNERRADTAPQALDAVLLQDSLERARRRRLLLLARLVRDTPRRLVRLHRPDGVRHERRDGT